MRLLALVSILLGAAVCTASPPSVKVKGTTVSGRLLEYADQEAFRGIPYAHAPVGPLRFNRPHPLKSFGTKSFNASDFGPACVQPYATPDIIFSEDCLTLNIQRPLGTNGHSAYPVMVWFHGGGFLFGRSSSPEFNATNLVAHSVSRGTPIIYVNLNYRVGPLGFPQGSEAARKGILNLGLRDQMVALEWIHDNIAAFGGDPRKVTLFGESAGAVSIAAHLLNPKVKQLAKGVILHSGGLLTSGNQPDMRSDAWERFVEAAGCATSRRKSTDWACLRVPSSDNAINATLAVSRRGVPLIYLPCVDGPGGVIPDLPSRLNSQGKFVNLPIITGLNLDEGTMFPPTATNSTQQIRDYIVGLYAGSARNPRALNKFIDTIFELYPDIPALGSPYNTGNETFGFDSQVKRMAAILGDLMMVSSVRHHNKALGKARVPLYTYFFTQRQESTIPRWGVAHSANIPFVYGQPQAPVSDSSRRLSVQMMDYWLSFAYTQTPNDGIGSTRDTWPRYTSHSQVALRLDGDEMGVVSDNYRSEKIDFILSNLKALGL
ncbi:hypothetical protein ONZ45_g17162 [Pleurotus djamor]|nr:hypothetical protein ONZ45_g17162 [Pleurotus djamor]